MTHGTHLHANGQSTTRPVVLIVDEDASALDAVEQALDRRFGTDYTIIAAPSSAQGMHLLRKLTDQGREIALVGAALRMSGIDGPELLAQARELQPGAGRALLIEMGDVTSSEPVRLATARGQADFWLLGGWESPEEWLYPLVQQALSSWSTAYRPRHEHVRIIGDQWSARSHQLRDRMTRNMVPYGFYDATSEAGQRLLSEHGVTADVLPVLILFNGHVCVDPTDAEVAQAMGVRTRPEPGTYDVVILGAGPSGLAAAVYAASEGLRTVVIEPRAIGGQAGSSSMIRNYPGFPRGISGNELTYRSFEQANLLGAQFVFSNPAIDLSSRGHDRVVALADGSEVVSRTVVIATGVSYRRLEIPDFDRLLGRGVFYGAAASEAVSVTGQRVTVVGGANSAGQAALHLAKYASHVTMLVRGASLEASMSDYLIREIAASTNIDVRTETRVVAAHGGQHLEAVTIEDIYTGEREQIDAAAAFIMIGAVPHTDWLANAVQRDPTGYLRTGGEAILTGESAIRPPMLLETSMPGVFAIGDVRSGSVKRVASAVGDGGVVIGLVHQYLAELPQPSENRSLDTGLVAPLLHPSV